MRSPIRPGGVALLFAILAAVTVTDGPAAAQPDDGPVDEHADEGADIAVPLSPSELSAQEAAVPPAPTIGVPAATSAIDDFLYSATLRKGRASKVCHGRIRRGTMWTFRELTSRFGGWAGSMYSCRERWNAAEEPDCNGTIVDPVRQPNFFSTCWSNHAQGRAMDIMVGTDGDGYNSERGRAIIRWLLAPDSAGNQNARARRLGVQQILFEDRCWDSDGDRGIGWWSSMRQCGIGHFDHVHVDLTLPGSTGNVSWWGAAPRVAPKVNSLLSWNRQNGAWSVRAFTNLKGTTTNRSSWKRVWDDVIRGDWDADGRVDDVILFDRASGRWVVHSFHRSRWTVRAGGQWTGGYDRLIAGDFNSDGRLNELFLLRSRDGRWQVQTWAGFTVRRRTAGNFNAAYDGVMAGDLNGTGRLNELLLWDVRRGNWMVKQFTRLAPGHVSSGRWRVGWDRIYVGDFDADGELDETLLWERRTGHWVIQDWVRNEPRTVRHGEFARSHDDLVVADLDTDGRLDEVLVRDIRTGRFSIHRWHALDRRWIRAGTWAKGSERIRAGTWH